MGYGYKYCVKFTSETYPKLSSKGKLWLEKAKLKLQKAIEQKLKADGKIELDSDAFGNFAFSSHPQAYWDAGLGDLPLLDLLVIGFTPDLKEWMDERTRVQAYDIGGRLVEVRTADFEDAVRQRSDEIVNYFKKMFK